jgi:hypothetical protein
MYMDRYDIACCSFNVEFRLSGEHIMFEIHIVYTSLINIM